MPLFHHPGRVDVLRVEHALRSLSVAASLGFVALCGRGIVVVPAGAPGVAVPVGRARVHQVEVAVVVAVPVYRAREVVVVEAVALDTDGVVVFLEVDADHPVVDPPVDVVGHVVPGGIAVVVDPVPGARGVGEGVAREVDIAVGRLVIGIVVVGIHVGVAFPRALERVGDILVLAAGESQAQCGHYGQHRQL